MNTTRSLSMREYISYARSPLRITSYNVCYTKLLRKPQQAERLMKDALPRVVTSVLAPSELESMRERLKQLPEPPEHARLGKDDWLGAIGVFFVVFLSMFPLLIPFLFMDSAVSALRVSNAIAIVMLFLTGYAFGRLTGRRPWKVGVSMVLFGGVLVAIVV